MNARPALLALAVIATLAACGKKDADTAATPAAAEPAAAEPTAVPAAPSPMARYRGQAVMGKDGWGLTVCGDPQQRIVTFAPDAQVVLDGFVAGGAKEFFLDGWGREVDGKPQFANIERIYTEGPGCDEKDLGLALFRARGNEPFWSLDVTPSGVNLQRPDQALVTAEYQPLEKAANGVRHFVGDTPEGKLELTLTPGKCSDGMSDTVYGWTAVARFKDQDLKGCAYSGLVSE
jgi:putative lipoprotein